MPLVAPGINSADGNDATQSWMQKLAGKTISESGQSNETSFAKKDLPQNHRVIPEGNSWTMDFQPDRLNVHLDKDNVVKKVTHG